VLVQGGQLTPHLFKLEEGDTLWLSKRIVGLFTMDDLPGDKQVVLASTGTGIAPYMSMLRGGLAKPSERKIAVIHGVRFSADLVYAQELETMAKANPNLLYAGTVSRAHKNPTPWHGEQGYVQDVWKRGRVESAWGLKPEAQNCHIFLCGNPRMIEDMTALLKTEGFKEHSRREPGQIHIEKYW